MPGDIGLVELGRSTAVDINTQDRFESKQQNDLYLFLGLFFTFLVVMIYFIMKYAFTGKLMSDNKTFFS